MWATISQYKATTGRPPVPQSFARTSLTSAVFNPAPTSGIASAGSRASVAAAPSPGGLPANTSSGDPAAATPAAVPFSPPPPVEQPPKGRRKAPTRPKGAAAAVPAPRVLVGVDNSDDAVIRGLQEQLAAAMTARAAQSAVLSTETAAAKQRLPIPRRGGVGKINDTDLKSPAEIAALPNLIGQVSETPDQRSVVAQAGEIRGTTAAEIRQFGSEVNAVPYGSSWNAVPVSNTPAQPVQVAVSRQLPTKAADSVIAADAAYDANADDSFRSIFKRVSGR